MGIFGRKKHTKRARRCRAPVLARLRGSRVGFDRVMDISRSGLRLRTPHRLHPGECVTVELHFPHMAEQLQLEATVAWRDGEGICGFEYSGVDREESAYLQLLIEHQEVLARTTW